MVEVETVSLSQAHGGNRLALGHGQAHVWTFADGTFDARRHGLVLDASETARAAQFQFDHLRDEYWAAHWLLRVALSHYDGRPPGAWRFVAEPDGRPVVEGDASAPDGLRFSLSHAAGRALVAVTRESAVGVDLEGAESLARMAEIAPRVLTPRELTLWRAQGDAAAAAHYALVQWTLKEAYAKGRGLGLKLDFAGFGFADAGGTWHLDPAPGDEPRRQDWRFVSFAPWPGACAALAVLTAHGGALDWRMVRLTP